MSEKRVRIWDNIKEEISYLDNYNRDNFSNPLISLGEDCYMTRYIIEYPTNIYDKNNKLIYEKDIVKIVNNGKEEIKYVNYDFIINKKLAETLKGEKDIEIIGNIHKNKDLYKQAIKK